VNVFRRLVVMMRWNLLWLRLPVVFFLLLAAYDGLEAYKYGRVLIEHWTWGLLLSPAADLWIMLNFVAVLLPVQASLVIPTFFDPKAEELYAHRTRNTLTWAFGLPVAVFVLWVLMWGSFPLENNADGTYMRMLPFIPWPSAPFF